jgi:hypothetical protein
MGYYVYYSGEISVSPPLSEEDAAVVRAFVNSERTESTQSIFAAIADSAEPDLPGYDGLLEVSGDRASLVPEEEESHHGVRLWLKLLAEHFLAPKGYVSNGEVLWEGEDSDDAGCIYVKDNRVEAIDNLIFNAGPSWAPNHYADDILRQAIRSLLESATTPAARRISPWWKRSMSRPYARSFQSSRK